MGQQIPSTHLLVSCSCVCVELCGYENWRDHWKFFIVTRCAEERGRERKGKPVFSVVFCVLLRLPHLQRKSRKSSRIKEAECTKFYERGLNKSVRQSKGEKLK